MYDTTIQTNKIISAGNLRSTSQQMKTLQSLPQGTILAKDAKTGGYTLYENVLAERRYRQTLSEYAKSGPILGAVRYGMASFLNSANPEVMVKSTSPLNQFKAVTQWESNLPKDNFQKFIAVQKPYYENVIIPMTIGAGIGAVGSIASKATGVWKGIYTGTKIAGAGLVSVGVGVDVGVTAANYQKGLVSPEQIQAKILGYGLQFGSMGFGASGMAKQNRSLIRDLTRQSSELNLRGG